MSSTNGHSPENGRQPHDDGQPSYRSDRLDRIIDEMRAEVDEAERRVVALNNQLTDARQVAQSLRKALTALDPETERETTTSNGKKGKGSARPGHAWTPSEARTQEVLNALVEHAGPITPTQLTKKMSGVGGETVSKSLEHLRQRGDVRVAGRTRGGGKLYVPMPEHVEGDAELELVPEAS